MGVGNTKCKSCVQNTYADQVAQSSCKKCDTGKTSKTGATSCTAESSVTKCAAGKMKLADGTCVNCPKGKYQDQTGATQCKLCAPNTYTEKEATTSCTRCQTGK